MRKSIAYRILLIIFISSVSLGNISWDTVKSNFTIPIPEETFDTYAKSFYHELNASNLSYKAFSHALNAYVKLSEDGALENNRYLTLIDLSLTSKLERFFLIDMEEKKIVHQSIVAHGRNTGSEYARHFSNKIGSFKSSLGFYKTAETYYGKHGLSLRLDGLESSNNNARKRAIVIHSADYVSKVFVKQNGRLGRSLGCPSLPKKDYNQVIDKIKNGALLFIYYPKDTYLQNSSLVYQKINKLMNPAESSSKTKDLSSL